MRIGDLGGGSPLFTNASRNAQEKSVNKIQFAVNVNSDASSDSSSVSLKARSSSGSPLDVSLSKSNAQIAASAAVSISSLREEQLALAKEATSSANPTTRGELQTRIETLQSEIERIANEAVDQNGNNVLNGSGTTLSSGNVIQLTDLSSLSDDPGVDVSTEAGAKSAVETLTDIASSNRFLSNSAVDSLSKAENILSSEIATAREARLDDPEKISDINEAEQVANEISQSLLSKYGNAQTAKSTQEDLILQTAFNTDLLLE